MRLNLLLPKPISLSSFQDCACISGHLFLDAFAGELSSISQSPYSTFDRAYLPYTSYSNTATCFTFDQHSCAPNCRVRSVSYTLISTVLTIQPRTGVNHAREAQSNRAHNLLGLIYLPFNAGWQLSYIYIPCGMARALRSEAAA